VLEVNDNVPVTHGATRIPATWVTHFIKNDAPLPTVDRPLASPEEEKIAAYIAELVPHEATLQLGIGGIPNALGRALAGHKNLGVHTEMINDTLMDLYRSGAITGRAKTLWPGKIVGSFAYGTAELYRFLDHNPVIELQPSAIVNDPIIIGQNSKMISVNTAVEVDLTGQVASESIGHLELSGVGGAQETHIGAQRSPGGRGIIAIRSRCEGSKPGPKIVFELKPGAKVSVSRNDVDTVVTEYGVASLAGLSVSRRVKTLISLAHPEDRELLMQQAIKHGYI
jgi:acyl-CoA hydrolase